MGERYYVTMVALVTVVKTVTIILTAVTAAD